MLALAISIIVGLVILFITSFIIYKRIPAPKGSEKLRINEENCSACKDTNCSLRKDDK